MCETSQTPETDALDFLFNFWYCEVVQPMPMTHEAGGEWVGLSEAAKVSTLSRSTIWRRAKDGKIPSREIDNGVGMATILVRRADMIRFREIEDLKRSLTSAA